ncbi:Ferrichrome-iron receptor, partial [human gut metagenome]
PANSFKVGSYTVVDALVRYDLARVGMAGSNVAQSPVRHRWLPFRLA